ncbi:hypothetical protein [Gemmata obscuriglobus]|uniref:hypothetical protein n=1 Tax=Gemmata obscuriglobus TaxID=114 RepID=UPI00137BE6BB|nr:hypothetical protein [Gemmata obscuriglobus]VTS08167.1 Uncharacterized protein OS=Acaryochloris marina (strain MBIC 11017) GN=AM1_F0129 PE=4 SV=1 [Gemmata obscuriglobus UQM 2246]
MARTEESQRREADRKEGWNARRWYEGIMAKQKTHMGGAVTETELLIANIDRSVTQEVRSVLDQATVDLYAETEDEWSATAPVDVWWDGAKACYASDGGHRIAAKEKNGRKKILCRVHRCDDAESALTLARLHAFGPANHAHGRARTPEDKRKTVRSCIALPEYAGESDRRIAEICKVGKWLVGQVRAEIAGAPKPAPRTVKGRFAAEAAPTPASGRATTAEERVIESLTKPRCRREAGRAARIGRHR